MTRDGYILQILPEDGGHVRTVHVSPRLLRVAAAAAGLLLLAAAAAVGLLFHQGAREARLAQLAEENRSLQARLQAADRTVESLAGTLDRMAAMEDRFRLLAGLPLVDPEVEQVGVGGAGGFGPDLAPEGRPARAGSAASAESLSEIDRLLRRAELLRTSLEEAADSVATHRELLASHPSILPVPTGVSWISSGYSHSRYHPVLGYNRPHLGIDISAPAGAPILATAGGRVSFAGRKEGYGRMVEIDHGNGFSTLYAHAASLDVRTGETVERGAVIGRVGETGLTSGPNVHYEVHVDGRPANPYSFLLTDRVF